MAGPFDNPLMETLVPGTPSGLQPEIIEDGRPDLVDRVGDFAVSAVETLGNAVDFQSVLDSQQVFDQYLAEVPRVRERFGNETEHLSDEALLAQMMTHDRNFRGEKLIPWAPEGGFLGLDPSEGMDPALSATEHRAFVLESVANAETPLEGGALAIALGAATPAYAAAKATGLQKGSKPSLAQLVAGVQGSTEALGKVGAEHFSNMKMALDRLGTVFGD